MIPLAGSISQPAITVKGDDRPAVLSRPVSRLSYSCNSPPGANDPLRSLASVWFRARRLLRLMPARARSLPASIQSAGLRAQSRPRE